ncbi:MAG: hypothetical protein MJ188_06265 [Treponema sp.]|nr:hypothetical protein [Treponema sp.]
MKKALRMILVYLIFLLFGIGFGALLYSLNQELLNHTVGKKLSLLNLNVYIKSLFYMAACMCMLVCPVIAFSRIRTKMGISQLITYIILSLLTWGIFIPSVFYFENKYSEKNGTSIYDSRNMLSGGYFRESLEENKVYYFTEDYDSALSYRAENVVIDKSHFGVVSTDVDGDSFSDNFFAEAAPYKDLIIKKSFNGKGIPVLISFDILLAEGKKAFFGGWSFYLGFLSFGLLLCAIYGISHFFEWRLVNVCGVVLVTSVCLLGNSFYYYPVCEGFRNSCAKIKVFSFLSQYMNEPLLVMVNVFFSLVLIVVGIVTYAIKKRRAKKDY